MTENMQANVQQSRQAVFAQCCLKNTMISKAIFVAIVSMLMKNIDDKKKMLKSNDNLPDECRECIMEETELQQDLITMLTAITFDRFGVIRGYLYDRDENGEYFLGVKGNKIKVYLLTLAEELYEYLTEGSEGFSLIAKKA
jgi:hypothetical protein